MRYSTHHKNYQIQNTHKNKLRIQKNKKTQKIIKNYKHIEIKYK